MNPADRQKIDEFIKDYIIIDCKMKILQAKIDYESFKENKWKVKAYKKHIKQLEQIKKIVDKNINVKHLEKLEIFRLTVKESAEKFGIPKNNLFKLKNEIREEFIPVYEAHKELINRFL